MLGVNAEKQMKQKEDVGAYRLTSSGNKLATSWSDPDNVIASRSTFSTSLHRTREHESL